MKPNVTTDGRYPNKVILLVRSVGFTFITGYTYNKYIHEDSISNLHA